MPKSIDFLNTNGGHILVCLFLLVAVGPLFTICKIPKGEDVIIFALGVLARSMVGGTAAELPDPALTKRKETIELSTETEPDKKA